MGNRTTRQRRKYIHDYARTLMQKGGMRAQEFPIEAKPAELLELIAGRLGSSGEFMSYIASESDETLGKIAGAAITSGGWWDEQVNDDDIRINQVDNFFRNSPRFSQKLLCIEVGASSNRLLESLAAQTVIAAMVDVVYQYHRKRA